ncbi:MAG: GDSL-like Lipase/Acylhydrolase [Firmicutes bacterium ADurb.Bin182]|nr:MAG: GDSL-like Lipase/Acylhydrolase [Firmicutes bacterium ADurb.Bin182]
MKIIKTVTVWGDSILGGIVPDPKGEKYIRLNEKCCVAGVEKALGLFIKNYSRFGMTSEKGLRLMQNNIDKLPSQSAALIELGGNDVDYNWAEIAEYPQCEHSPNVPPEKFTKNIESMVTLLKSRGIVPLLATLPPIHSKRYFEKFTKNIASKENILKWLKDIENIYRSQAFYSELIKKTAARLNCRLIDIRAAFMRQDDFARYLAADGIHPNAEGHELMKRTYIDYARKNLPSFNII